MLTRLALFTALLLAGCASSTGTTDTQAGDQGGDRPQDGGNDGSNGDSNDGTSADTQADGSNADADDGDAGDGDAGDGGADVIGVSVTASGDGVRFSVTIRSPDTGCDRYADWWEVVGSDGELIERRILAHSHVDEQPFTRSGGTVTVASDRELIVRAHMNDDGYGGEAMRGTVDDGFSPAEDITASWFPELAEAPPLPENCAF